MTLAERYDHFCGTPSSINEHLQTLRRYAEQCESVAEFGVDIGQSTTAFLMAQPKRLLSVDVCQVAELEELFALGNAELKLEATRGYNIGKTRWVFLLHDSRKLVIPNVDLLFIDSAHYYDQMKIELERHAGQVRKWIICHDTFSYGTIGEGGHVGIVPAIGEFLVAHPEWQEELHLPNNNGLLVLRRVDVD